MLKGKLRNKVSKVLWLINENQISFNIFDENAALIFDIISKFEMIAHNLKRLKIYLIKFIKLSTHLFFMFC